VTTNVSPVVPLSALNNKQAALSIAARWVREILGVFIWLVVFIQLLVTDVFGWLAEYFPTLSFALRYRIFLFLGIISVLWFILGHRRFLLFVGYALAYPFVVVFWHVPRTFFTNWPMFVAFYPAIHSMIATFRLNLLLFTSALICSLAICISKNHAIVSSGIGILIGYLVLHFYRRLRIAFMPSTVFADMTGTLRALWTKLGRMPSGKEGGPVVVHSSSADASILFTNNTFFFYVLTSGLHWVAEHLRDVVRSRKLDLYFAASLFYTLVLTVLIFGIAYYGLHRLSPDSFVGVSNPNLVDFVGLSFSRSRFVLSVNRSLV